MVWIKINIKMSAEDRYVFVAVWYDQQSSLLRKFYLGYYLSDKTIDLVSPNAVLLYLLFELLLLCFTLY